MGIGNQSLALILTEHCYRPIEGRLLCLGKQTVLLSRDKILEHFDLYGIDNAKLIDAFEKEYDDRTRHKQRFSLTTINDAVLLASFCNASYDALDRSDYEGANILHDMNREVPPDLRSQFEFIYNGSCMDNVFDAATYLRNTSRMLKPYGRIVHVESAGSYPGAFTMFSPEWFFSYYAVNDFLDCRVYATLYRRLRNTPGKGRLDVFSYRPFFTRDPNYDYYNAAKSIDGILRVLVVAEKGRPQSIGRHLVEAHDDQGDFQWIGTQRGRRRAGRHRP